MIDELSTMIDNVSMDNNSSKISSRHPNILLTGLRRSGKTSIQRVIFTKMHPSQTQFLKATPQLTLNQFSCSSFITFQVHELPGQLRFSPSLRFPSSVSEKNSQSSSYDDVEATNLIEGEFSVECLLKRCNAVVYVIDAQDDYSRSVSSLNSIIQAGQHINPRLRYEVFIHKVDQLSEEDRIETQQDIHNQIQDYLATTRTGVSGASPITAFGSNSNSQNILINFHLTSIFDHSIFEAFSKVIQKLMPQFNHLEELLNYLISASNIEHAFLFDIQTKISIATDSSPTDMQMYELCCDMIDLFINMSQIYGKPNGNVVQALEDYAEDDRIMHDQHSEENNGIDADGNHASITNGMYSPTNSDSNSSLSTTPVRVSCSSLTDETSELTSNVFDSMSSSIVKLTGGRALYLKEINRHLALVCVLREEALTKQAIIEYNVNQLKKTILELLNLTHQISSSS